MRCPKCKQETELNSLKCSHCGTKVASICSECSTINPITAIECSKCSKTLLRICSNCGAANLPDADICRKCGHNISENNLPQEQTIPKYYAEENSQQKVKQKLLDGIKDGDNRIITLCGESGIGKNIVLYSVINDLKTAKLIWLNGSCSQITQLSPFGYFQDLMLNFFNINNYCPDTLQLKKNSMKFFKQDFPSLSNGEILDLLNLLYPDTLDKYENIYFNKIKMFTIMKKVIMTIVEKMKTIFIINNFEFIDGMSFDFIKELLNDDYIIERCKFIFICTESKPGQGIIHTPKLSDKNYLDLSIAAFSKTQSEIFIKQLKDNNPMGKPDIDFIIKFSKGNPSLIEQAILLQKDVKRNNLKEVTYNSLDSLINLRLNILKKENLKCYRLLTAMSVLGEKFYPSMLEKFDSNSPIEFEQLISFLIENGYITQINKNAFEFKSKLIWKKIVAFVKNDEQFEEILNSLYELLSAYKQSSVALIGYIVQKLNNNDQAFDIWTLLMKQASYIGDISLYIISQKQALKLIENKNNEFYTKVKKNIYTRVGKLLEPIDSETAFEYLQKAIMLIDDYEDNVHIELLGYLASCSMKSGNYCGVIECIDNVLNKIPENMVIEKSLIKSKQIKPLLRLGNYGQIINMCETEILPELENLICKNKNQGKIKLKDIFEIWLDIYYDFAEALVFQGDNKAFNTIQAIYDTLDKNKIDDKKYHCKANLLLALANTIKGDIKTSNCILNDMLKDYDLANFDGLIASRWNFIDVLNKFFENDYNKLQTELFNVVAYANNVNDNFTKNILKTLLSKLLKNNNQNKKALEILEEQVAYFAKEKVATGVLLSWYLIAEIKLITKGTQFALDIATKALDIAQSPNINNYYFIALFNKLIGEIYLAKQDFESANVYFEKSIFISKQFDLEYILFKTYLQSAKLCQELALPKTSKRNDYVVQALKLYQNAKNIPIVTEQNFLQKIIKEDVNVLTSFCKLNGIIIKKEK